MKAKTIGHDGENKSIVATIFGTVFLVWLAFGFSIGAVFALGVAGSIAAVLSRYSRCATYIDKCAVKMHCKSGRLITPDLCMMQHCLPCVEQTYLWQHHSVSYCLIVLFETQF